MQRISFHSHEIAFVLKSPGKIRTWLGKVSQQEKKEISSLSYVFCSDKYLLGINQKYLNHNTLTDVITFDLGEDSGIEGEIYISVERVEENSQKYNVDFEEELRRVIMHGFLHLLGYSDKTTSQKAQMRKKEQACLSLYS